MRGVQSSRTLANEKTEKKNVDAGGDSPSQAILSAGRSEGCLTHDRDKILEGKAQGEGTGIERLGVQILVTGGGSVSEALGEKENC